MLFIMGIMAQNHVTLGYCNGQVAQKSDHVLSGTGWVSAAIRLPASSLAAYEGSELTKVRAALVQRVNIDTLSVWIRHSLEGEDITSGTITRNTDPKIAKGWNEVDLKSPYVVDGKEDIFVGFSFKQRADVQGVSLVGDNMYEVSYLKLGDGSWRDVGADGQISIEAVVSGAKVPGYDIGISAANVVPCPSSGAYALRATLQAHNYGMNTVEALDFLFKTADDEIPAHVDMTIVSGETVTVSFVVDPGRDIQDENLSVSLISLGSNTDEVEANNNVKADYLFLRNVLIEEFTTERCVNCPTVAGYLHQLLENGDERDRMFAACHHEGFYTDQFTQPWDKDLVWLYAIGASTYAPAVIINRRPVFTGSDGNPSVAFVPSSLSQLAGWVADEMSRPAESVVGVNLSLNADTTMVSVTVNCRKNKFYNTINPRLTLYLLENGIMSSKQTGATGMFEQNHVTRAQNETWGVPVEWDGDTFLYTYDFAIDPAWVKDNLEIVAFLGNYNAESNTDCVIDNVGGARLKNSTTTGIKQVDYRNSVEAEGNTVFSLSGVRLTSVPTAKGVYIINGKKHVVK